MRYYSLVGDSDFLAHHGVKGMHWGIRRYQNYDGTRIGSSPRVVYGTPGLPAPSSLGAKSSGPRHTGKNPRRQSIKNTVRGTLSGHYLRNKLNKNLPQNEAEALERGWRKLSAKDSSMHQFHTEDGVKNSKWVSKDGHREVVFTGKGENQHITTDPRDQGTYNIFDPKKNPLGHAVLDVIPYMVLGNSADDSTTIYDRSIDSLKNFMDKSIDTLDDSSIANGKKFCEDHKIISTAKFGVSKEEHYERNKFNTDVPKTAEEAKKLGWNSGVSNNAHQRNTKPGQRNIKYVSPDGHREGVYNYKGQRVGGSYNYSSPITNKPGHLVNDVLPYIRYGSNPNDKTTALRRTEELLGLYDAERTRRKIRNAIR